MSQRIAIILILLPCSAVADLIPIKSTVGYGSGSAIARVKGGSVGLTANHVIGDKMSCNLSGVRYEIYALKRYPEHDVAIIFVKGYATVNEHKVSSSRPKNGMSLNYSGFPLKIIKYGSCNVTNQSDGKHYFWVNTQMVSGISGGPVVKNNIIYGVVSGSGQIPVGDHHIESVIGDTRLAANWLKENLKRCKTEGCKYTDQKPVDSKGPGAVYALPAELP